MVVYCAKLMKNLESLNILIDHKISNIAEQLTRDKLSKVISITICCTVHYKVKLIEEICAPIFPMPTARKKSNATSVRCTSVKLSASRAIEPLCIDPPPICASNAGVDDRAPSSQMVPADGPTLEIGIELSGTCITGGWDENGAVRGGDCSRVSFIMVIKALSRTRDHAWEY